MTMTIYVTGDTHGGLDMKKLESKRFPEGKKLTKNDYVVILGDFGIWQNKRAYDFLIWLGNKPFTTLFVEGNHEDYNFLRTFPDVEMFGSKVRKISDSIFHLKRGEVYMIDKYKVFTFGGARSIDRFTACRQEGVDWFPDEECTYEEECKALENLAKHSNKVDLIFTHTCSKSTLDELTNIYPMFKKEYDAQNKFLEKVKNTVEYKAFFFGHMHKDYKVNDKEIALYNNIINVEEVII